MIGSILVADSFVAPPIGLKLATFCALASLLECEVYIWYS